MEDKPILVNGSSLPALASAAVRYVVVTGGTWAVAKGWVEADQLEGIATVAVTVATAAYGLWRTRRTKQQLIITAEAAPNRVAIVQ